MKAPATFFTLKLAMLSLAAVALLSAVEAIPVYIFAPVQLDAYLAFLGVQIIGTLYVILLLSCRCQIHRTPKIQKSFLVKLIFDLLPIIPITMMTCMGSAEYTVMFGPMYLIEQIVSMIVVVYAGPLLYGMSIAIGGSTKLKSPLAGSFIALLAGTVLGVSAYAVYALAFGAVSSWEPQFFIYTAAMFCFNSAVTRFVILKNTQEAESSSWLKKWGTEPVGTDNSRARRIILRTYIAITAIFVIIFVAGWFLTAPYANYWAITAGQDSGKIVIVRGGMFMSTDFPMSYLQQLYIPALFDRSLKKRTAKAEAWLYDTKQDTLEKKEWPIYIDYMIFYNKIMYHSPTGGLISISGFDDEDGDIKSRIRLLMPDGDIEFDYKHDEIIHRYAISPGEDKIVFSDKKGMWIFDLSTQRKTMVAGVSEDEAFLNICWPSPDTIFYFMMTMEPNEEGKCFRRPLKDKDKRGVFRHDLKTGERRKLAEYDTFFVTPDGRRIASCQRKEKGAEEQQKKYEMSLISIETGEQLGHFEHEHPCVPFPRQPDFGPSSLPEQFFLIELSNSSYLASWLTDTDFVNLKFIDWQGNVTQETRFEDIKVFGRSSWISQDKYLIQTALKKQIHGIKWLSCQQKDAVIADINTGKTSYISDIIEKHGK